MAASRSIDLSSVPAWEPLQVFNLTPIVTGKGLPTLQELNLTWADILRPVLPRRKSRGSMSEFQRRFSECRWRQRINCSYAEQCYNYLWSLGAQACGVPPASQWSRFCESGSVAWDGESVDGRYRATDCRSCAEGGVWVLYNCVLNGNVDGTTVWYEGTQESVSDPHIVIHVRPSGW
ncbi:hypothetical protein DFP72DRAFT_931109 [Ephemerocybe angulata]|uniref:Uncharacterized protein n=1 Tax=Ephemerocybe angulata TaxID=980116 RepID=A0A8H6LV89_9AGAR|nr:hypothetical protein DFP72DRAFT_931109 [Tulosesus angulatus]